MKTSNPSSESEPDPKAAAPSEATFTSSGQAVSNEEEKSDGFDPFADIPKEPAQAPAATPPVPLDILALTVKGIYHNIALARHYDGWELTPDEYNAWEKICTWLGQYLPAKYLGIAIPAIFIVMSTMGKLMGDMQVHADAKAANKMHTQGDQSGKS